MGRPSTTFEPIAARDLVAGGSVAATKHESKGGDWEKITFGDVVITARKPPEAEIQRSAELSSAALARALPKLLRPGVRIYPKKNVALYSADPEHPSVIIRELNGKVQRGVVKDGIFKVTIKNRKAKTTIKNTKLRATD